MIHQKIHYYPYPIHFSFFSYIFSYHHTNPQRDVQTDYHTFQRSSSAIFSLKNSVGRPPSFTFFQHYGLPSLFCGFSQFNNNYGGNEKFIVVINYQGNILLLQYQKMRKKSQTNKNIRSISKSKKAVVKNNQQELRFVQTLSNQYSNLLQAVTNIKYPLKKPNENSNNQKKLRQQYAKLLQLNKCMKQQFQTGLQRYQEEQKVLVEFLQVSGLKNIDNFISRYEQNESQIMNIRQKYQLIDKKVIQDRGKIFLQSKINQGLKEYQAEKDKRLAAENKYHKLKSQLQKAKQQEKNIDTQLTNFQIKTRKLEKDLTVVQKQRKQRKLRKQIKQNL